LALLLNLMTNATSPSLNGAVHQIVAHTLSRCTNSLKDEKNSLHKSSKIIGANQASRSKQNSFGTEASPCL
jgi:hypothetical protein